MSGKFKNHLAKLTINNTGEFFGRFSTTFPEILTLIAKDITKISSKLTILFRVTKILVRLIFCKFWIFRKFP